MVHLIHYELKNRHLFGAYTALTDAIKAVSGVWMHLPESTWLVETNRTAQDVENELAPLTVVGDTLFVIRVYEDWMAHGLTTEQVLWLQARNFNAVMPSLLGLNQTLNGLGPVTRALSGLR